MITITITKDNLKKLYNGKEGDYEIKTTNEKDIHTSDYLDKMLISVLAELSFNDDTSLPMAA